ncbi:hypothetical protein VTO42DRAFT_3351 [Malbranchea cinnamomea]
MSVPHQTSRSRGLQNNNLRLCGLMRQGLSGPEVRRQPPVSSQACRDRRGESFMAIVARRLDRYYIRIFLWKFQNASSSSSSPQSLFSLSHPPKFGLPAITLNRWQQRPSPSPPRLNTAWCISFYSAKPYSGRRRPSATPCDEAFNKEPPRARSQTAGRSTCASLTSRGCATWSSFPTATHGRCIANCMAGGAPAWGGQHPRGHDYASRTPAWSGREREVGGGEEAGRLDRDLVRG